MYNKNSFRKKAIIPILCMSLLTTTGAFTSLAASYQDTEAHWAANAIERWSDFDVILGFEGVFRPDESITRAEMATIIGRLMNYQTKADNRFEDLDDNWYTDAILMAVQESVILGDGNKVRPNDPVTRQEALVMLSRALTIKAQGDGKTEFSDAEDIAGWALGYVAAMEEKGYVNGFEDGTFRPNENITRASVITLVDNMIKGFYNKPGTYRGTVDGIVLVNTADVVLETMTINGDLILAQGVGDGKVTLKDSLLNGEKIILGGTLEESNTSIILPTPKPTSSPGGGGSGSGGGSNVQEAKETDIIVNSEYADKTGSVTVDRKKYEYGTNAFDTLEKAVAKANELDKAATIKLLSDLNVESTVKITADGLALDGNQKEITVASGVKDGIQVEVADDVTIQDVTIQMNDEEGKWNGSYGIQAYRSKVTVKNVKATGADAALCVNGAEVTLEGVVDVSGNEFGGIEVSQGSGVTELPKLIGTAANLKNDTEELSQKPTVWIDGADVLTNAVVAVSGLNEAPMENNQIYYYIGKLPSEVTADVASVDDLQEALANPEKTFLNITQDITIDETMVIGRRMIIKGQDEEKTLRFENKNGLQLVNVGEVFIENISVEVEQNQEGWNGIYGIQVYGESNVVLKNVKATGADAGILVNGAQVTLEGIVDVSGNEFGGIEVSQGEGVTSTPKLMGTADNLKNDTEEIGKKPTIWIDGAAALTNAVVNVDGMNEVPMDNDQIYFYLEFIAPVDTAEVANEEELRLALENETITTINVTADFNIETVVKIRRGVTLIGNGHTIAFGEGANNGLQLINAPEEIRIEGLNFVMSDTNPGEWKGLYGIQAYLSNVTLKDISVTGADAGILINGSQVTLEGIVDVSGNEFGGIEVSKGEGIEQLPQLAGAKENLKNTTEGIGEKPTIWIDGVQSSGLTADVVAVEGLSGVQNPDNEDQIYFFLA